MEQLLIAVCLFAGRTSPQLDSIRKSPTLEQAVQAPPSAAPAPPAPVGQRSQTGAAAASRTTTTTGSQKPPDLLEQRKGKIANRVWSIFLPARSSSAVGDFQSVGCGWLKSYL